jgi:type I restriction enzyme S subunit
LKYGPQDVLSVSGEYGCVNQIEFMGRSYAGVSVKDYHVVETGDVVYTKSPLKVAPFGIIKANKGRSGIVSTLYAVYRPTSNARADYIDHYFSRTFNLNSYLQPIVKKGAKNDMKVKNSDVLAGSVWVPKIDEQKKIAECLSSIDTLIAAEAEKLEVLKDHKKGLMQQLFPAPGETTPRLRFPEFQSAKAWSETSLAHQAELISGLHLSPTEYGETGEIPYFTGPSDFTNQSSFSKKWTRETGNAAVATNILITVKGSGVGDLWHLAIPRIAIGRQLMAVRAVRCSDVFLYQLLTTKIMRFKTLASGNLIPGLSRGDILGMKLCFPSLAEQQKIAEALTSIDALVAAQGSKIDALKAHKQGLMQQLFPAPAKASA